MGRTVDAASAAEALAAGYYQGAAAKCRTRLGNMKARGARVRRDVAQVFQRFSVGGVVVCRGSRLE
jgi:hypothetical protein